MLIVSLQEREKTRSVTLSSSLSIYRLMKIQLAFIRGFNYM